MTEFCLFQPDRSLWFGSFLGIETKMKRSKLIPGLLVLVILFILIVFWVRQDGTQKKQPVVPMGEKDVVRLAVANALITAPVLIALEKDFFSEAGLKVKITGENSDGKGTF